MRHTQSVALVLGIDCATPPSSVALVRGETELAHRLGPFGRGTDAWILVAIDAVLDAVGVTLQQLDALAVSAGPGTFTGVRVGLATAVGLATGGALPVTGIGTLEALIEGTLAAANRPAQRHTLACVDARRGEVYAAVSEFDVTRPELPVRLAWGPIMTPAREIVARLEQPPPLAAGTGLALDDELARAVELVGDCPPVAVSVARLAARTLARQGTAGLPPPIPVYLRPPDAQRPRNPLITPPDR